MAILVLAHNGIGLGHVSRLGSICEFLFENGNKPTLITQTPNFESTQITYPTYNISSLNYSGPDYIKMAELAIKTHCTFSSPSIFIEDTHPSKLRLPDKVRKYLIVRPTTFEYLEKLQRDFGKYYLKFWLADHFNSPSWPYDDEQTSKILSWENFDFLGPVYKQISDKSRKRILNKYQELIGRPFFIFTMGGGGQHEGSNDAPYFFEQSKVIMTSLRKQLPDAIMLFIKGPLFPKDIVVPEEFDVLEFEEDLPALIEQSKGVILRPGFNSIWECIAATTPFLVLKGSNYVEPIDSRLARLQNQNLLVTLEDIAQGRTHEFVQACKRTRSQFSGIPNGKLLDITRRTNQDTRVKELNKTRVGLFLRRSDMDEYRHTANALEQNGLMISPVIVEVASHQTLNDFEGLPFFNLKDNCYEDLNQYLLLNDFDIVVDTTSFKGLKSVLSRPIYSAKPIKTYKSFKDFVANETDKDPNALRIHGISGEVSVSKFQDVVSRIKDKRLFVRIDDVISLDDELTYLLELFSNRFAVSLEVIPYLASFDENDLVKFGTEFTVGQHGYSHFIDIDNSIGIKSEFSFYTPKESDLRNIAKGRQILNQRFPEMFRGGFSAPFDSYPHWLGDYWGSLGGKFLSLINNQQDSWLPTLLAAVDTWNWRNGRLYTLEHLLGSVLENVVKRGYVGVVLHPIHFSTDANRQFIEYFFNILFDANFEGFDITSRAISQRRALITSTSRKYNF